MNASPKNIPPNDNGTGSDQDDRCLSHFRAGLHYRDANLPPRNPDFVGREKLKASVREFVSRPRAGGYLVLIGGMGRGKMVFLTDLVHEEIEANREPICHFIDYHPSVSGEGDTIVRSLLDQWRS